MFQKSNNNLFKFIGISLLLLSLIIIFYVFQKSEKTDSVNIKPLIFDELEPNNLSKRYIINTKPNILSKTSALIDVDNKYVIFTNNPNLKVPIASTTKLMTSLIVLENFKLDQTLKVTSKAANINGSKMNLYTDEEITVLNLLKGLLIVSGNDAAYTFADNYHGKEGNGFDAFVKAMNEKATELNLKNTKFLNPAGLNDDAYSTAFDLGIIASEFIRNPELTKITKTSEEVISDNSGKIKHTLKNSNRLVDPAESLYMAESFGLKTGFTELAGHCLVTALDYKGRKLIGIVLNTSEYSPPASARESYKLLNWGKAQIDNL